MVVIQIEWSRANTRHDYVENNSMSNQENLKQLVYVSKPKAEMSLSEVRALLVKARINNHFQDITGILLFDGETFLQVLEGPEDAVLPLFDKIAQDPRHTQVDALFQRSVSTRDFDDWSMGLAHIEGDHMRSLPGLMDLSKARTILAASETANELVDAIKFDVMPEGAAA